jgi:hypothetical protein
MISVFKTGVSSDPAQAGSIPVRLRYQGLSCPLASFVRLPCLRPGTDAEVGASLKWATAKVERSSQRDNGDRTQGRERQAERGGDFNEPPPF